MIRLLSLILTIFPFLVIGQNNSEMMIIKYENGSVFVGEKVTEKSGIISLRILTNDTIAIDRRFTKEIFDHQNAIIYNNGKYLRTTGSYCTLTFGLNGAALLNSGDQRVSSHLEFIWAKRLNDKWNLGLGVGFEFNEAKVAGFKFDTQILSIFGYGRYYLSEGPKRIFAFSRLGVGGAAEENEDGIPVEHKGGVNGMAGLGIHFASRRKTRFLISLGYYFQKTSGREFFLDNLGNEIETNFDIMIRRLVFKFGWEFG